MSPRSRHLAALTLTAGLLATTSAPAAALGLVDAGSPPPQPEPAPVVIDELAVPPSPIPRTGWGDDRLEPVLDALDDFMRHRCVGAATVGIAYRGVPIGEWGLGRTNGRASSTVLDPACGNDQTDPYDPAAENVDHTTPMMLGSISKPVTAATLRWVLHRTYEEHTGQQITDAELEAMRVFGNDFPVPLMPQELVDLYTGAVPLPEELDVSACEGPGGEPVVDPRWSDITIGQLLAHRAGLPKSAPNYTTQIVPRLAFLRGLDSEADLAAAHQAQRDQAPDPAAFDAAVAALEAGGDPVYFLGQPTLVETLMVVAGRCLVNEPGDHVYSNTTPAYWQVMINHLDPSGRYVSETGDPASHLGSAFQRFFSETVGLNTFANVGIFRVLGETGVEGYERRVPQQRHWTGSQQTYVPMRWDTKRPHCVFDGESCSTTPWRNGDRAHWAYGVEKVPFHLTYGLRSPGTGSLAAQPRFMLALMAERWIGGYANDPRIGEARDGQWNLTTSHNGSLDGGHAYVFQFGGGAQSWKVPALDGTGRISDAFTDLHSGSSAIPAGVDLFVAVNQQTDPKCQASEALADSHGGGNGRLDQFSVRPPQTYTCKGAYRLLDDFMIFGLGQVDWDGLITDLEDPGPGVAVRPGSGSLSPVTPDPVPADEPVRQVVSRRR